MRSHTCPERPEPSNFHASNVITLDDEQRAGEVRRLFNRIAPVYDGLNHWMSLGQHQVWKQMSVNWSKPFTGATCLDVCCGSGDLTRLLAKAVGSNGHVVGLDFAVAQLERAKQITYLQSGHSPIQWVQGDALDLPFADNFFDAVTMGYGLRNVTQIQVALRELLRVTKPGRNVSILDFHRPDNPVMQQFQTWCLTQVVEPLSALFDMQSEYAYILPSLEKFPKGQQQVEMAERVGFVNAIHYTIAGGMMGVLVAQKPNS